MKKDIFSQIKTGEYGINVDYQCSLLNVIESFQMSDKDLFKVFGLPKNIIESIIIGSIPPSPNYINSIINGISSLQPNNEEQSHYKKIALLNASCVYKEAIMSKIPNEKIIILDDNYLSDAYKCLDFCDMKDLDFVCMDDSKWFKKCILFNYLYNHCDSSLLYKAYFFDGTSAYKWFNTELKKLKKLREQTESIEYSYFKASIIESLEKYHIVNVGKKVERKIEIDFVNNIDEYGDFLIDNCVKKSTELVSVKLNGYTYKSISDALNRLLNNKSLDNTVLDKLARIKGNMFVREYNLKNHKGNSFTYHFNKLYYLSDLNYEEYASWLNISFYVVKSYVVGNTSPNHSSINKLKERLLTIYEDENTNKCLKNEIMELIGTLDVLFEKKKDNFNHSLYLNRKLELLREFYNSHSELPKFGRKRFLNQDAYLFYDSIRYIDKRNKYVGINTETNLKMIDLLVEINKSESNMTEDIYVNESKIFIGEIVSKLMICLGVDCFDLFKLLKIEVENPNGIVINDSSVSREFINTLIERLNTCFDEATKEYQLVVIHKTIQNLRNVESLKSPRKTFE